MADVGALNIKFNLDDAAFKRGIKSATSGISGFQAKIITLNQALSLATTTIRGTADAITSLARPFVDAARENENYRLRLSATLGTMEEANKLFKSMSDYAATVPFQYGDIMAAATSLSGVVKGGAAEVERLMPMIGDLAAVSGLSIQETTDQIIRMYSNGAASADLFQQRGILAMLGFQSGVSYTAEQTMKKLEYEYERNGSKFKGLTVEMAKTWDGMISMIGDTWREFRITVMDAGLYDALKEALQDINREFKEWLLNNKELIKQKIPIYVEKIKIFLEGVAEAFTKIVKGIENIINAWHSMPDTLKRAIIYSIPGAAGGAVTGGLIGAVSGGPIGALGGAIIGGASGAGSGALFGAVGADKLVRHTADAITGKNNNIANSIEEINKEIANYEEQLSKLDALQKAAGVDKEWQARIAELKAERQALANLREAGRRNTPTAPEEFTPYKPTFPSFSKPTGSDNLIDPLGDNSADRIKAQTELYESQLREMEINIANVQGRVWEAQRLEEEHRYTNQLNNLNNWLSEKRITIEQHNALVEMLEQEHIANMAGIDREQTEEQRKQLEQRNRDIDAALEEYIQAEKEARQKIEMEQQAHNQQIRDAVVGPWKDGMRDIITGAEDVGDALEKMFTRILENYLDMLLEMAAAELFGGGATKDDAFGNIVGSMLSSIFGGFRAEGGPVSPGKFYVVGENGPEILATQGAGTVIPNNKLGGGETFNINVQMPANAASDPANAKRMGNIFGESIKNTVREVIMDEKRNGGIL